MTMQERIARALALADCGGEDTPTNSAYVERAWMDYMQDASAALATMREPTPEMILAGRRADLVIDEDAEAKGHNLVSRSQRADAIFRAMIDAAISQASEQP